MPKLRRTQAAARKRHDTKRGEVDPEEAADCKQDGTYDPTSDHSHEGSESDMESTESTRSLSSVVHHAATAIKNYVTGKHRGSPSPDPDLCPDWEVEEVSRAVVS
jgi:hypothetical protein